MKTRLISILATLLLSSQAFGLKLNRYTGLSAEFSASQNTNASTSLDAAYYNPAGVVFGREGFAIRFTDQATIGSVSFERGENKGDDFGISAVSPMIMATYHHNRWGIFLSSGLVGGGVTRFEGEHPVFDENRRYVIDSINESELVNELVPGGSEDGEALITDARFSNNALSAMNAFIGTNVGVVYKASDFISIAAGVKAMYTFGNLDLGGDIEVFNDSLGWFYEEKDVKLKAKQSGSGFAGILGIHMKPTDALTIALRAETLTKISVTTTQVEDTADIIEEESINRSDIAPTIAWGIDYQVTDDLSIQSSGAYYFNTSAEYGPLLGFDVSDGIKNDWEIGFGATSRPNDWLKLSSGLLYFKSGFNEEIRTSNRFSIDALFIGGGAEFFLNQNWSVTTAAMGMLYWEADTALAGETATQPAAQTTIDQDYLVISLDLTFYL